MSLTKQKWLGFGVGLAILIFGLLCLNYTKADGLEHHREVARQHGWPQPGAPILYGGVLAVMLGAGTIGYTLGQGRRKD